MLAIPFDDLVKKICEKTKVSEKLIKEKIVAKKKELSGLVSDEGAAFIIASEMGVDIMGDMSTKKLKIVDVLVGMRSVSVVGRVIQTFDTKEFKTKDGKSGKVRAFLLGDDTGQVRIVTWNDQVSIVDKLRPGMAVRVIGAYSRENKYSGMELHMGVRSKLEPAEESEAPAITMKGESRNSDKFRGVIVQTYRPNFYDVCPTCGSSAKENTCKDHGQIVPNKAMIASILVDDGEKCLRCVAFKDVAEKLAGLSTEDARKILIDKSEIILLEQVEELLLGKFVEVEGRIRRNVNFDRDELLISNVNLDVDALDLLKEIKN